MDELKELYLALVRVAHIFSGILWIGILYYFNFGQALKFPAMEASARSNAITVLVPHLLNMFRWAALSTVVFGVLYIVSVGMDVGSAYFETGRFKSILVGGTIGIIMAANVWFIIWPLQQKVIAGTKAVAEGGTAPADQPKWARTALLASRTNTMLSIPMLFFMVASRNLPSLWG